MKNTINFASGRMHKLHRQKLETVSSHNLRLTQNERRVDYSKSHLNRCLYAKYGSDIQIHEAINFDFRSRGVQPKKNSVEALEIVLSASPTYYRDDADAYGEYSPDKLNAWSKASLKWLKRKYSDNLIRVDLHLDEKTPHMHIIVVPVVEKTLKRRRTKSQIENNVSAQTYKSNRLDADSMTKRHHLRSFQTEYAKAVEHLGIVRGLPKSYVDSQSLKELGQTLKSKDPSQKKVKNLLAKFNNTVSQKLTESVMAYSKRLLEAAHEFYNKRIALLVDENRRLRAANVYLENKFRLERERSKIYRDHLGSLDVMDLKPTMSDLGLAKDTSAQDSAKLKCAFKAKQERMPNGRET